MGTFKICITLWSFQKPSIIGMIEKDFPVEKKIYQSLNLPLLYTKVLNSFNLFSS